MRLKLKHITLSLSLLTLAVACKEEEAISINTPSEGKTPIELSVGGVDTPSPALTRAVITTPKENMSNFDAITNIYFVMKSEYDTDNPDFGGAQTTKYAVSRGKVAAGSSEIEFDDTNKKYWDDAHARSTMLTLWAYAQKRDNYWSNCKFEKENPNWDNSDPLTKFIDDEFNTTKKEDVAWRTERIVPAIKVWMVSQDVQQSETSVNEQDLMFSNNLANNGTDKDNRLKFGVPTTGKFPTGENAKMIFYHAMSKITVKIVAGDGFTASSTSNDFNISSDNVILKGFNTSGTFHIGDGMFEYINGQTDTKMWLNTTNKNPYPAVYYTYEALAIPNVHGNVDGLTDTNSRFVKGENDLTDDKDVMMQFTIDNNTYKITSDALFDALMQHDASGNQTDPVPNATKKTGTEADASMGTYIPLEAGKNYVFTFKVSKSKINGITAQVVNWETVEANDIPASNARIKLQLEDRGTAVTSGVDFYRTKDSGNSVITDTYKGYKWETGYQKGTGDFSGNTWQPTNWYWNDNTEYYHFRAVGEKKDSDPVAPAVTSNAFTLTAGETYSDYIWGAPFKELDSPTPSANTTKIVYSNTYGFDGTYNGSDDNTHQIYHGIGPTPDPIKLLMFHMMSEVTIKVQSVTGDAAVQLTNGDDKTTIKFENIHTTGSVALGNGLVSTRGEATTSNITMSTTANQWLYGAIPQNLDGPTTAATDDVILVITTPDHNEYRVSMKDVKVSTVNTANIANPYNRQVGGTGADMDKYIINRWYPGFKYEYTFVLSKKKIEDITATVVNWETVTAEDEVQIQ